MRLDWKKLIEKNGFQKLSNFTRINMYGKICLKCSKHRQMNMSIFIVNNFFYIAITVNVSHWSVECKKVFRIFLFDGQQNSKHKAILIIFTDFAWTEHFSSAAVFSDRFLRYWIFSDFYGTVKNNSISSVKFNRCVELIIPL